MDDYNDFNEYNHEDFTLIKQNIKNTTINESSSLFFRK